MFSAAVVFAQAPSSGGGGGGGDGSGGGNGGGSGGSGGGGVNGPPVVKSWTPPVYPPELKKENEQGRVELHFLVSESGAISKVRVARSSDRRFNEAAVASLEKWVLEPGLDDGRPVTMSTGVRLYFKLPEPGTPLLSPPRESLPYALPKTLPKVVSQPVDTRFPVWLEERITKGVVYAELVIDTEGGVAEVKVLDASHPDFVRRSEAKFREWKFEPAKQGEIAIPGKTRASLEFIAMGERQKNENDTDVFALAPPEGVAAGDYCEREPERVAMVDPVFPYGLATAGGSGEAVVRFTVSEFSNIRDIEVVSASDPECGRSLVAALEGSFIKAGYKSLKPATLTLTWRHVFRQPPAEALPRVDGEAAESGEARMIRHLAGGAEVLGARGLDGKLRPVWRASPVMPRAFEGKGVKGSATVEFIVDREGRACLPRVIEASHPEFGWAAMTALNQWVFDPLTRGGQPTEARVRVPFGF
jgi:TonB family protein